MTDIDDRLDEIEARATAATPGPWAMWDGYGPTSDGLMGVSRFGPSTGETVVQSGEYGAHPLYGRREDWDFLGTVREDVPWLVDLARDGAHMPEARREAMDYLHGKDRNAGLDGRLAGPLGLVRALVARAEAAERERDEVLAALALVNAHLDEQHDEDGQPWPWVASVRAALSGGA